MFRILRQRTSGSAVRRMLDMFSSMMQNVFFVDFSEEGAVANFSAAGRALRLFSRA